jgi:ankyrin repeat domain-containing protein 50
MTPKFVKKALTLLPSTLDATYERMLTGIDELYFEEAQRLIRWLAFQLRPLTLSELAEAAVTDPSGAGVVDLENRGTPEEVLEVLSGLVTLETNSEEEDEGESSSSESPVFEDENVQDPLSVRCVSGRSRVRLAHFSVKEYLESERILQSKAKDFYLENAKEHEFLAQSCLVYLTQYSSSCEKTSSNQDLLEFPLLKYAAKSWYHHSLIGLSSDVSRETSLLQSEDAKRDWLLLHRPDESWAEPFEIVDDLDDLGAGLYYASYVGLAAVVSMLIDRGADVNADGGKFGNPLQIASTVGYDKVVSILLKHGVDVNAKKGDHDYALLIAIQQGHEKIVSMLLEAGANVNARGGFCGSALQLASDRGYEKIVSMLLERGADTNAPGSFHNSALQMASARGHENIVQMLREHVAHSSRSDRLKDSN